MTEGRRESRAYQATIYVIVCLGALPILLPFYWMVVASLKTKERVEAYPPDWLPVVPSHFVTIAGQELPVTVIDDGKASGTGVCRVRLRHEQGVFLRLSAGELGREIVEEFHAEIDGVRRRVVPRGGAESEAEGTIAVDLPGAQREASVPIDELEVVPELRTFWSVLGDELRVLSEPAEVPRQGDCRIRWKGASAPILVAPKYCTAGPPALVYVGDQRRPLPVQVVARSEFGGYWTIRLVCPAEGLSVSVAELRQEHKTRRFAMIDGRRHEVKLLNRDTAAGTALVETLNELQVVQLPAEHLERETRAVYRAPVLDQELVVEPLEAELPGDPAAPIAVRVPGPIAVVPEHIRSQAPLQPQWSNFKTAWQEQTFDLYVVNTLFIAALVVLGTVLSCGLVGYAFARLEFRGRNLLFLILLSTMMIPGQVTSIPTFVMFVKFGWMDSYKPLILPALLAQAAFFVFLYRQFMLTIPADLEDSARIDGCGPLSTWWLIMMPLSRPIMITVAVFAFVGVWNDFLYPLLYINSDERQTVALGLQNFKSAFQHDDPQLLMAASLMMMIPSIVMFFIAQKAFIRGVVVSGVKG